MITNGYCENAQFRHSDKAPGRNLNAIDSRLLLANGEPLNVQPVSLALTNPRPPTPNHGFPKTQIPKQVKDDRVMFLRNPCRDNEARRPQKVTTGMSVQSMVSSLD